MKICSKARVVQVSLLLTEFARVCGKFCSETSPIAAAHGAGKLIFKLTLPERYSSKKPKKTSHSIFKPLKLEENRALFQRG
jgi:hypothetical protein